MIGVSICWAICQSSLGSCLAQQQVHMYIRDSADFAVNHLMVRFSAFRGKNQLWAKHSLLSSWQVATNACWTGLNRVSPKLCMDKGSANSKWSGKVSVTSKYLSKHWKEGFYWNNGYWSLIYKHGKLSEMVCIRFPANSAWVNMVLIQTNWQPLVPLSKGRILLKHNIYWKLIYIICKGT